MSAAPEERIEWIVNDLRYKAPEIHEQVMRVHMADLVKRTRRQCANVLRGLAMAGGPGNAALLDAAEELDGMNDE